MGNEERFYEWVAPAQDEVTPIAGARNLLVGLIICVGLALLAFALLVTALGIPLDVI